MADATTSVGSSAVPQGTRDRGTGLAGALLGAIALLAWATLILPAIGWRMPLPPMRGPDPTVAGGSRVARPSDGDLPGSAACRGDTDWATTLTGWLSGCAQPTRTSAGDAAAGAPAAVRPTAASPAACRPALPPRGSR